MPNGRKDFKFGEMSGKLDTLIATVNDLKVDIKTLGSDFNTMEKGRLTNAESRINLLEARLANEIKEDEKLSDKIWDVVKGLLPTLIATIGFLIIFYLTNQ